MVSEVYFSSMENRTGNRNRNGPFIVVETQKERALGAKQMIERLARLPYVVGYHWFQFADEPIKGREDGEDFNFGLVDVNDRAYEQLVTALTEINRQVPELHRSGLIKEGLKRIDKGWKVFRARKKVKIDGNLDEWSLPDAWITNTQARDPFNRFGDFYLSWTPGGLMLGAVYLNYVGFESDPDVYLDNERLFVTVARGGDAQNVITLTVLLDQVNSKQEVSETYFHKVVPLSIYVKPGQTVAKELDAFRGARRTNSVEKIIEVLIPISALGGQPLKIGETLNVGIGVSLRGNSKELFWPIPLSKQVPSIEQLAVVHLSEEM